MSSHSLCVAYCRPCSTLGAPETAITLHHEPPRLANGEGMDKCDIFVIYPYFDHIDHRVCTEWPGTRSCLLGAGNMDTSYYHWLRACDPGDGNTQPQILTERTHQQKGELEAVAVGASPGAAFMLASSLG